MAKAKTSKKSKQFRLGDHKKPLLVLVAALFVAIGTAAVLQTQAYPSYVNICNSSASDNYIRSFNNNNKAEYKNIAKGGCWKTYNVGGVARVHVDPANSAIDTYKVGIIGEGYGPCHSKWAVDLISNPPNADAVRYRTYNSRDCDE